MMNPVLIDNYYDSPRDFFADFKKIRAERARAGHSSLEPCETDASLFFASWTYLYERNIASPFFKRAFLSISRDVCDIYRIDHGSGILERNPEYKKGSWKELTGAVRLWQNRAFTMEGLKTPDKISEHRKEFARVFGLMANIKAFQEAQWLAKHCDLEITSHDDRRSEMGLPADPEHLMSMIVDFRNYIKQQVNRSRQNLAERPATIRLFQLLGSTAAAVPRGWHNT